MRVQLCLNNSSPMVLNWWQSKRTRDYIEMNFSEVMPVIPKKDEFIRVMEANQVLENRVLFEGYVKWATENYIKIIDYRGLLQSRT